MAERLFTRVEVARILSVPESFLVELEQEEVVWVELAPDQGPSYSSHMMERARLARVLVEEMGVNLAGVEVALRLREQLDDAHRQVEAMLREVHRRLVGGRGTG